MAGQYIRAHVHLASSAQLLFADLTNSIFSREGANGRVELQRFDQSFENLPSETSLWIDGTLTRWINAPGVERRLEEVQVNDSQELSLLLLLDDLRQMRQIGRLTRDSLARADEGERLDDEVIASLRRWPLRGMEVLDF
ncbi:hypothetical protein [Engelhardtia mirabilis]